MHLTRHFKSAAPVAAAPSAPTPAAPTPAPLPNPVNAPSIAAAPLVGNGFTMQLPKPEGPLQPTVDGSGNAVGPDGLPVPPPEAAPAPKPKELTADEPVLYSPGVFIKGISQRIKSATSAQFEGALDAKSPTGRAPGIPSLATPGWLQPGQDGHGVYSFIRKAVLSPLLARGKTPFGGITGRNDRFAAPLYAAADQVAAVSSPDISNLGLLANWAGSAASNYFSDPAVGAQLGGYVDQGIGALQNAQFLPK